MQPKNDPFEDPLLTEGLDPATKSTVKVQAETAKHRWEKYKSFVGAAVLGVSAALVAVFSIAKWVLPTLLVLALFLPVRFGLLALGKSLLVRRTLRGIKETGDQSRR